MVRTKSLEAYFIQPNDFYSNNVKNEEEFGKVSHLEKLLLSWIDSQPNFPKNYDKNLVKNFLRGSKYRLETAKQKLEFYFLARNVHADLLTNRSPTSDDIISASNNVTILCLPRLTEKNELIWLFRLENTNSEDFDIAASIKLFFMYFDLVQTLTYPTHGHIAIFDEDNFSSNHFFKFVSNTLINTIGILRKYAIRLNQIHIINPPTFIDKTIKIVKPLLHKSVQNRFLVHKNTKCLYDYLSTDLLPSDYDGNLPTVKELNGDWYNLLKHHADWFEQQRTCIIDEVVKQKDASFEHDIGVEGSFRKLNID